MTGSRPFQHLWTVHTIVCNVKRASIRMIKPTTLARGNGAQLVPDLTVKIMMQARNQRITARCATLSSTEFIVNVIILTQNSVKITKHVSSAKHNILSSKEKGTSAGLPNVPCVGNTYT